jgi:hypothetical protein
MFLFKSRPLKSDTSYGMENAENPLESSTVEGQE